MFKKIIIVSNLCMLASASFTFPSSTSLYTNYYNTSNCSNVPLKTTEINTVCTDNTKIGEISKCCYDLLDKIELYSNITFNKCYLSMFENKSYYIDYSCDENSADNITYVQIFAIIGIILMALFVISIIGCLIKKICCRSDYEPM